MTLTPNERRFQLAISHLSQASAHVDAWRSGEFDAGTEDLLAGLVHSQIALIALAMPEQERLEADGLGLDLLDALCRGLP